MCDRQRTVRERLVTAGDKLREAIDEALSEAGKQLDELRRRQLRTRPERLLDQARLRIDHLGERLVSHREGTVERKRVHLESMRKLLAAIGPERVLQRGFAMVRDPRGKLVTDAVEARKQASLDVVFRDGSLVVSPGSGAKKAPRRKSQGGKDDQSELF